MRLRQIGGGCVLVLACVLAPASGADAQAPTSTGLAGLLPDLILNEITLPSPTNPGLSHVVHFSPLGGTDLSNPAVGIVRSFNKLMVEQLSTFPLGSSSGGFTYKFDESLGTFGRASNSFGPAFAERAVTIGRHRLNGGFTYQHTSFGMFEGQNLDNGSIKIYIRHEDCCSVTPGSSGGGGGGGGGGTGAGGVVPIPDGSLLTPFFEGDLIEAALSLKVSTDTEVFFANFGLTDRLDVGVAVPIVQVSLDAKVLATILRLSTAAEPLVHTFEAGNPNATQKLFQRSGTATGLGDVALRFKYEFLKTARGGVAGVADVRFPTGDGQNLLGAGGRQIKVLLVASGGTDRFAEHINLGYTSVRGDLGKFGLLASLGSNVPLSDEFNYTGGIELIPGPRLTFFSDIIGRTLRGAGRLELATKKFQYEIPVAVQPVPFVLLDEFDPRGGNLNLLLGSAGLKFNLVGNLLVSANVLVPLTQGGLRSRLTTAIGIDYAF